MSRARQESDDEVRSWADIALDYAELISNSQRDSQYLRETGLCPNVVGLLGGSHPNRVLDAGGGSGWLSDELPHSTVYVADLAPTVSSTHSSATVQDVCSLGFRDAAFDATVCSLVLMYVEDMAAALGEMCRVTRGGGQLVVAIMHPYFYRSFTERSGRLELERDLSRPCTESLWIGRLVGPVAYRYRPFDHYINAVIRAGWTVREVRDWFLDERDYAARTPAKAPSRSGHVPLYSFIHAVKQ